MNKSLFQKLTFSLVCSVFFLFSSCENFLNGNLLKDSIEAQISYANSPSVTVRINGDDSVHFTSGSGDYTLKPTDKKIVEFELISNDYYFENWSVVEKNDSKKDASSYVDIKVTNNENSYTTTITILKDSPDLLIKPVTKLKPGVFSASPTYYPTGVSFFKAVTLTFTQPMKKADLENWTHVKITDKNGNSIKENFNIPELSEDGKILTIVPIASKIRNLLTNVQTFEIKVTVDGGLNDTENSPFVTKPFTHTYVINKPVDDAPPVLTEINISKEILNLETREKTLIPINQNGFEENWAFDELENHHTNGSIFINCKGTDNSSGIKALKVTETLIKNVDGTDGSGTVSGTGGNFIEKTTGVFEPDTFKYDLQTTRDGIIQLDFELLGYNEKVSNKETFYVVRDATSPSMSLNLDPSVNILYQVNENGMQDYDVIDSVGSYDRVYKDFYEPVFINIKYWDEGDENNVKDFITDFIYKPEDSEHQAFYISDKGYKLIRDPRKNTIIKAFAETKYGNTVEKTIIIDKSFKFNITDTEIVSPSWYTEPYKAKVTFSYPDTCWGLTFFYERKENKNDVYNADFNFVERGRSYVTLTPGFYKFYLRYTADYFDHFFNCSVDTLEFQVTDEGKVASLQGNVPINNSDWPKLSKRNITNGGPNSGICNVRYDYSSLGNSAYNFQLKLVMKNFYNNIGYIDRDIPTDSMTDPFVLDSGYLYEPYFLCYDNYGIVLADSRDINIDYSAYNIDIRDVHNLPFDVDAISFAGNADSSPVNAVFNVSSFFDNPDVEQKITYYVVKNNESLTKMTYSEDLVKNLTEYTFEPGSDFIAKSKKTQVPVEVSENGYYTLFVKVSDKNGNYCIYSGLFSSYVGGELDLSKITVSSNTITLPHEKAYGSYCYYYDDGNNWKQDDGVKSAQTENKEFTLTANDGYKNKFVKLVSYSDAGRSFWFTGPNRNYNKTVYLYPDYYLSNLKIRNKGMMELKNGYQLFIDQPAFVRVLYSKTNWGDDADLWGTRGFETDCRVENETFTYTPNIKEVPSGYYYCTVVHFADGTSAMGTVYQKP